MRNPFRLKFIFLVAPVVVGFVYSTLISAAECLSYSQSVFQFQDIEDFGREIVAKETQTLSELEAQVAEDLDQIEKIYVREETTGDEAIRKTQLGVYFERIHLAENESDYYPYETKLEAYRAFLSNLRPKRMLELRSNEDIQDSLSELPIQFDLTTMLADPIYGVKAEDGKVSNPYYETQLKLVHQLATTPKPILETSPDGPSKNYQILTENDLDRLSQLSSAVIIVPDDVDHHLDRGAKDLVKDLMRRPDIDWVGLEMLPDNLQKYSDTYIFSDSNTEEWKEAEGILRRYYTQSWDAYWEKNNQELAVFSILTEARKFKKRIVALDVSNAYNLTVEASDFSAPAVMLLRNYLWAIRTPKTGRGIIFGGEAHFDDGLFSAVPFVGIRVQDFLRNEGFENIFFKAQLKQESETKSDDLIDPEQPLSRPQSEQMDVTFPL